MLSLGDTEGVPAPGTVLFGYRHVSGIPLCPCHDPGNYVSCVQGLTLLKFELQCWCGRSCKGEFDDEAERDEFLRMNVS